MGKDSLLETPSALGERLVGELDVSMFHKLLMERQIERECLPMQTASNVI
jgi:hypothetical protein